MRVAFISLIPYDTYYADLIKLHSGDPDYFDIEILTNHSDPVHKWCKMLTDKGVDVEFWYLSRYSGNVKTFKHKYGHNIRRIPSFNIKKIFGRYFENEISLSMLKELKRNQISHVLLLNYLQNSRILIDFSDILIAFSRRKGIRNFPIYGGDSIDNYPFIKKKLKLLFLKTTDGLLCQSRREINLMVDKLKFPLEKTHYFLNPLDLQYFHKIPKDQAAKQLELDSAFKYLLYVGRFEYAKGIHHIIQIMPLILKHNPRIVFIMLGRGSYLSELSKQINDLELTEKVIIKEHVENEELIFYYNIADILLLPSYSEGTPNVLMEAIACNTVCISTDVGGIPDLLSEGIGIMVKPKDNEALLNEICKVLENGFVINQNKRNKLLAEIDINAKGRELLEILGRNG